jgi:protein TonB
VTETEAVTAADAAPMEAAAVAEPVRAEAAVESAGDAVVMVSAEAIDAAAVDEDAAVEMTVAAVPVAAAASAEPAAADGEDAAAVRAGEDRVVRPVEDATPVTVADVAIAAVAEADITVAAVDVEEETPPVAEAKPEPPVAEAKPEPPVKPKKPAAQAASAPKPQKPAAQQGTGRAKPQKPANTDNLAAAYASRLAKHLVANGRLPPAQSGFPRNAIVVFTIDAGGQAYGIQVFSSTGSAYMDGEAIAAVRRASPFPGIPRELDTNSFIVRAPIRFPPAN